MEHPAARFHFHGRRKGRKLRAGQQRLIDELLPRLAVELPESGELALAPLFSAAREIWVEIGFGAGEHLAWQAERNPDVGILGSEVFHNGVARLLAHAAERGLENIRIYPEDARALLELLPSASISRAFLLFPDPWPKLRHAKRRFVGRSNLDRLARVMRPGAELRMATDDPGQLRWMLEQTLAHPAFEWLAAGPADWRTRPADWPATRYEEKALAEGLRAAYLRFRRR